MGDRVSIQFQDPDGEKSVALFHHWGGRWFAHFTAAWYIGYKKSVKQEVGLSQGTPVTRCEARNVLVQYISQLSKFRNMRGLVGFNSDNGPVYSDVFLSHSLYLGKDERDGDNSDNGAYIIRTDTCELSNEHGEIIEVIAPEIIVNSQKKNDVEEKVEF